MTHGTAPVEVFQYSEGRLSQLLSPNDSSWTGVGVSRKYHLEYFKEYFGHFAHQTPLTIVAEWHYTDRDFLEDYAAYYVRCFEGKYSCTCRRLHFFRGSFSKDELFAAALGRSTSLDESKLNEAYLGFIVLKPLPYTTIGRTCLKTYDDAPDRRHYPVTRSYEVHVLGFNLKVDSIAFQEQDTVAAACATSALWSVFQGTAVLFHHPVYSPVEVTRIATEQFPGLRRSFPNRGLNPQQIAAAIRRAGLEPEVTGITTRALLQATAYAYLRAKIPLWLMAGLYDISDPDEPRPYQDDFHSGHAVAIMGYSLGEATSTPYPVGPGTLLRSSRIDELYVHDDQVGPFARLKFGGPRLDLSRYKCPEHPDVELTMTSSWRSETGKPNSVCLAPETLVIPLYHKVRIGLDPVLMKVFELDEFLENLRCEQVFSLTERLEWEVYLQTGSNLKSSLREKGIAWGLSEPRLTTFLEQSMPRFVWRATAFEGGRAALDLIYDATDIEQGDILFAMLIYHPEIKKHTSPD